MTTTRILPANFKLAHGSHATFERGACLMEAVAYVAAEKARRPIIEATVRAFERAIEVAP